MAGVGVLSDHSPRKLDVFSGAIYWTTWSADKLLKTDQLGRGNMSAVLTGQTSIESLRFVHALRYGESMSSASASILSLKPRVSVTEAVSVTDWRCTESRPELETVIK